MGENAFVSIRSTLRIISLVPSLTELVIELGLGQALVGRTGFCIHPRQAVQDIPKVGGTKDVNLAAIRALAPTHVLVNVDENRLETVQALGAFVPHVIVTHPCTPQDNLGLIDQLIESIKALDATDSIAYSAVSMRAKALKQALNQGIYRLSQMRSQQPLQRVLYLIWCDPWMTVARDTYISHMLGLINWQTWPDVAGGDGLSSPGAARYPTLSMDEPWLAQIDRVLLSSEPYRFGPQHRAELEVWMRKRGSGATVELVDGELLSWYGSRAVAGLAYLEGLVSTAATDAPP
jgi:ABC-type Fe3+-hydroxamate transport system substrate-binding protein